MRHDIRLLYLVNTPLCPVPVSVRLPTNSCMQGCFFCCKNSWHGDRRYALSHVLTKDDFLRLWQQIIVKGDFRFVWPQRKILNALKQKRVLRFVREDLFEPGIKEITNAVLLGCYSRHYGLLVKTSSINVANYIGAIKKIKHCIVFSVTDLLGNYNKKIEAINILVKAGLKVTLVLGPIFEYNEKIKEILLTVDKHILGVEVAWLHGKPSWIPQKYLTRGDFKIIRCEQQYKKYHLVRVVGKIFCLTGRREIPVRFYFSSYFSNGRPCCFVNM